MNNTYDNCEPRRPNTVNAIEKTLSVIDYISSKDATFSEIQRQLNLPKATLHRILQSLESHRLIKKDRATDSYSLGLRFIYYGEQVKSRTDLPAIVSDHIQDLAADIGESCCLSVLYQNTVLTLESFEGDASGLTSRLLPLSPLNCSASGKIYLSHFPDEKLRAYFDSSSPVKRTINSICTYEDFLAEREKIKTDGISYDNEEYEYGLFCMSAPLCNHEGPLDATIGVTGPKARIFMKSASAIEKKLRKVTDEISKTLIEIKYVSEY